MAKDVVSEKKYLELGTSGLHRYAGHVHEEFLRELQGRRGMELYKEMSDNDPIIGAIFFVVDMLIREVDYRVQPYSDSPEDVRMAEFVEECMMDMSHSWEDLISEILSMLIFGWSYHEIVYKRRLGDSKDPTKNSKHNDGLIGWRKMPIRAQETLWKWEFDEEGGIQGMYQQAPPDWLMRFIPIEKSLLFRTTIRKNNPEGRSVLRNAYRAWYFKKNIEEIEGIGIERDLAGLPVAWVSPNILSPDASAEEKALFEEIKKIVINIRRDEQEGVIFPLAYDEQGNKMFNLELLSTGGRRQFDTSQIIARYDQRITMVVLADFILLGHEGVGSFALADEKTNIFTMALRTWVKNITEVFNAHAIPKLMRLNGFKTTELPRIEPNIVSTIPFAEVGKYISELAGAGMPLFPNEEIESYLLSLANVPTGERGT